VRLLEYPAPHFGAPGGLLHAPGLGERQSARLTVDRTRRGHGEELRATYRD
jgi:hypothetical protein